MTQQRRVVIAGAFYCAGHESIADALAEALRSREAGGARVAVLDLLERGAPRSSRLARMAYGAGEEFFPDGSGDLATLARYEPDDPVVRELMSGGTAAAASALEALRPDAVLAVHPVAGAIAAESREHVGCLLATVVPDLGPGRMWIHPRTDLHFVASDEVRDALAIRRVGWDAIVVSGVPAGEAPDRTATRVAFGLEDRFTVTVPDTGRADARAIVGALAAVGVQVVTTLDARTGAPGRWRSRPVVKVAGSVPLPALMAAADAVVCGPCGACQWAAPASATPLVVVEPVPALERSSVDLLVTGGAAMVARDPEQAAARALYLARHPERLASMSGDAGRLGRPSAARVICERLHDAIG